MANAGLGIAIGESGIGTVLTKYPLRVPLNQRSYAWEDGHVSTLLTDFSNAITGENKTYFLGTIVLTHSEDGRWEVADGQQRLATTAILISAIRDHLFSGTPNEKEAAAKYTSNFLLEFDENSGEHVPKLSLNAEDNDFFVKNALLTPDQPDRGKAKISAESHRRLAQAMAICKEHVGKIIAQFAKADQPKRLYDWIAFLRESAVIIEIKVPDHFNAYTLFETLNDRGLRASQADILKNYLFGKAQDRLSEVAPKWATMASILESVDVDDLLLTYLRHYWISYNGPTIEKELAQRIREKVTGRQQAVETAIALAANATDYAALFAPLEHTGWKEYDKKTRAYIYILTRVLQLEQIRPLLLAVIRHFSPNEALLAFKLFLSWSVRFLIAGGGGAGVLDRHYGLRAKEITEGEVKTAAALSERMKGIVRTDAEFLEGMRKARVSKKHLARYYLRAMELYFNGASDPELGGILEDTTVYNLEHVLPLSPSEKWNLPDDVVQGYSKRLGNMTLLDPSENVDAGNKSFEEKLAIYKSASLAITKEVAKASTWGPEQIDGRQAVMAELAPKIWIL
ncbi:DUF262 domain-containing protein [Dongia sedimenti]|uniref:DUF262 domain-containing HNH endonuclease family protein n=1 Tax=Dongia sedimenti TaxID=3064282 RepID=A0ABU0YEX9_9PROT|nr:DUF262 domain-containing HNH endonuclease family protein [Rhodospirillaceae bacterium R-7]